MKRIMALVVGVVLALVVAAPIAGAARQEPPSPVEQDFELPPAESGCDFTIRVQVSGKGKTITLPGDRFIFTSPGLTATLTNLDNGNQETFGITGAFHQTTLENGDVQWVVTGRNLLTDPDAGFVLAIGRFSFVFDENGNLAEPLSGKGRLIDICEALE